MSQKLTTVALGTGLAVVAFLAAGAAHAEERKVIVTVDPSKETTLTIKPFASELSKQVAAPADVAKPMTSCTASVTYNNGVTDADCSIDF